MIHTTVRRLRKIIDDPARTPGHIFNVRGEGFRFVPSADRPTLTTVVAAPAHAPGAVDRLIEAEEALREHDAPRLRQALDRAQAAVGLS
ncbi:MAG: hypothetical protein AAFV53_17565 [Myxococcota bacterium]